MRIAVVGASGRTGREVVQQALSRGHDTLAVARNPQALTLPDGGTDASGAGRVRVRGADILDVKGLGLALEGAEVVVSAVGIGASRHPTDLYSAGTANLLKAMSSTGARRLAVVSAAPVGPRQDQPMLQRYLAMPILELVFGATYVDMRRMEALLRDSEVQWTVLRAPRLIDKSPAGRYRLDDRPLRRGGSVRIPDLAAALLDTVSRTDLGRQSLYVAS
ncbi:MAG: hypothetical protein QOF53_432 [Nocardioidaceae bacterium]|jgi:putative NADH-flavin reductase|nr:hypothetical protein [Nocardioidaceae bacterium]